jgi:hypothetical protein
MGIKITGAIEVEQMFAHLADEAPKRSLRALRRESKKLHTLARKMAPVDHGDLEQAIEIEETKVGGRGKIEIEVFVNTDKPVSDRPGKTVGHYAYEIHEHLTPMGPMQLGDRSNQKQILNPDVIVGGGFMERAGEEVEKGIEDAVADELDRLI